MFGSGRRFCAGIVPVCLVSSYLSSTMVLTHSMLFVSFRFKFDAWKFIGGCNYVLGVSPEDANRSQSTKRRV